MRTTLRIARLELSTLFYSPVAWLVLIIFTFQSGLTFADLIERFESFIKMGYRPNGGLTENIFSSSYRFLFAVKNNLYLYIPLLTMGLISREVSSGSIKLLYSSPVTIMGMVCGKFLAMMAYGLLLVLVLFAFAAAGVFSIQHLDFKLVVSGIFGLYLLICAYSAIGLFMSSLTSYQVVAAISTLVVLAALNFIGTIGQNIPFVRDLTYFLSISGRADKMISGLISTKDLLYFVIVITLFLGFTMMKLQNGLESRPVLVKAGRYVAIFCMALFLGYCSSRSGFIGYYDMTANKDQTLTVNSLKVLKQLTKPVKITTYVNLFDINKERLMPEKLNIDKDRFEPYVRFLPDMDLQYVYYYDSTDNDYLFTQNPGIRGAALAKKIAEATGDDPEMFLTPAEIKKQIDLTPEENKNTRLIEYNGKKTFVRFFADMDHFPSETEITAALKTLVGNSPRIAFLVGNNERDISKTGDKEYNTVAKKLNFRSALINQGFTPDTVSLQNDSIPQDIAALVIADPKTAFSAEEMDKIQKYINSGGNLLIAGEPGRQAVLDPLLSTFGIQMMDGKIFRESKDFEPDFVLAGISKEVVGQWKDFTDMYNRKAKISMPGAAGLSYTNNGLYTATTMIESNPEDSWNAVRTVNTDSGKVNYLPASGDVKKALPLGIALTRKFSGREQKIFILGDADLFSNSELNRYNVETNNFNVSVAAFKWFSNNEYPVDASRPAKKDIDFLISRPGIMVVRIVFLGVIPALLLIIGSFILIRRRRN